MVLWMRGFAEACTSMVKRVVWARDEVGGAGDEERTDWAAPTFTLSSRNLDPEESCCMQLVAAWGCDAGSFADGTSSHLALAMRSAFPFGSGAWKRG